MINIWHKPYHYFLFSDGTYTNYSSATGGYHSGQMKHFRLHSAILNFPHHYTPIKSCVSVSSTSDSFAESKKKANVTHIMWGFLCYSRKIWNPICEQTAWLTTLFWLLNCIFNVLLFYCATSQRYYKCNCTIISKFSL